MFKLETRQGFPVEVGSLRLTPEAQALTLHLPFGGLMYNRPTAVLVERHGEVERIPVVDVTRAAQLGLLALTLLALIVALRTGTNK